MNTKQIYSWLPLILLIIAIVVIPTLGVEQYDYWKGFIKDVDGYNSINAVIALCGGVLNIITIIFLYVNYVVQKKQIEDTKKDVEFNRALDMIYKHIDYTKTAYNQSTIFISEITNMYRRHIKDKVAHIENQKNNQPKFAYDEDRSLFAGNCVDVNDQMKAFHEFVNSIIGHYILICYNPVLTEPEIRQLSIIIRQMFYTNILTDLQKLSLLYRDLEVDDSDLKFYFEDNNQNADEGIVDYHRERNEIKATNLKYQRLFEDKSHAGYMERANLIRKSHKIID